MRGYFQYFQHGRRPPSPVSKFLPFTFIEQTFLECPPYARGARQILKNNINIPLEVREMGGRLGGI